MSKFVNPYFGADKGSLRPLTIEVGVDDYNLIKCIRPQQGTLSITVTTLWKKLCNELKQRNITDVSSYEQFEQFVSDCRLITPSELANAQGEGGVPNQPAKGTNAKANRGNDRTGAKRVRGVGKTDAPIVPDI